MLSSPDRECFAGRFVTESAALGDLQREVVAESERSKDRAGESTASTMNLPKRSSRASSNPPETLLVLTASTPSTGLSTLRRNGPKLLLWSEQQTRG
jgi:hypothetical protein